MKPELKTRLETLPGWSWNSIADSWVEHLELLRVFAVREGHSNVPVDYTENGMKLGQWTRSRRREHKKLSPQRQAELEAVPGWFWGTKADYTWSRKYRVLETYIAREGHARVPTGHVEDGVKLSTWVSEQRTNRAGMSAERRAKLESLPGWSWTVSQDVWDEWYEKLTQFIAREGHSRVPQGHVEDSAALGSWVTVQRQKREVLAPGRRARLEELPGWEWNPHDARWDSTYALLLEYATEYDTCYVPYDRRYKNVRLGSWVSLQRSNYTKGKLSAERQERLGNIPGWEWTVT